MSILQFIWVGDLDESKTQRLQNPQALSYNKGHPKKMIVRQDKKETRIGRKNSKIPPDYALESAVSNRMISRNHVTIERLSKGNYMLYDHSLNGTYVNFVRVIGGTILKHEDVVCFGHINGANIKPGESVTPFATDLKYRVEIIDKISGDKSATGGASIITRKPDNNNYSQSESDQYDEAASSELNRKSKSNKHKSLINNEKSKKIKLMKQESDDSDRSSDSSDASNNNTNNNNTNINPNNYNNYNPYGYPPQNIGYAWSSGNCPPASQQNQPQNYDNRGAPPPIGFIIPPVDLSLNQTTPAYQSDRQNHSIAIDQSNRANYLNQPMANSHPIVSPSAPPSIDRVASSEAAVSHRPPTIDDRQLNEGSIDNRSRSSEYQRGLDKLAELMADDDDLQPEKMDRLKKTYELN